MVLTSKSANHKPWPWALSILSKFSEILACENIHFSPLIAVARNVPSGEEGGETDVLAGYGNFGSAVNGKRFFGSSHWKIPWKTGKSIKVGPFSGWNVSNGISCPIYTFLAVYTSFNCYRLGSHLGFPSGNGLGASRSPGFTIKWNKFLPIVKSMFVPTEFSGFFYLNGKRPFKPVEVILYFLRG